MYRRRRAPGVGLLFLISQLYNIGFHRIPPVTVSVIAINVAVYLRLLNNLPSVGKACVSAHYVWFNGDWKRLVFAAFYHLDDFHLYYNMASFVWKGISLERTLGSPNFLYVLTVFTVLTNAVLVGLDVALANVTENSSYIFSCAAGFSGVIFALKVLTTYNLPSASTRVMGLFSIPLRWAYWFELILIQVIVPNASFTGHLAGILVGLMYVKGPLRHIMDAASALVSGSGVTRETRPSYTYHTGTTGQRQDAPHRPPRARVSDSESEDQELQQAIRASLLETHINRAPFPDDYDPQLQSAIRDSLDSSGETQSRWSNGASSKSAPCSTQQTTLYPRLHDPPPNSYTNEHFAGSSPYPAQGKALHTRIPHSYTGETSVQSPPYPTEEEVRFPEPSAPPLVPDNPLPYPRDNRMPAPDSSDSIGRRGLAPGSLNEVRRRRLERFER